MDDEDLPSSPAEFTQIVQLKAVPARSTSAVDAQNLSLRWGRLFEFVGNDSDTNSVAPAEIEASSVRPSKPHRVRTKDSDPLIVEYFQVLRRSRSSTSENAANERQLLRLKEEFTSALLASLGKDSIEPGVISQADDLVTRELGNNRLVALAWLNAIFLDNFSRPQIAADVLTLVGRLPYSMSAPTGTTMALAGLSHQSPIVQEAAIRAFERWANDESLKILNNVQCATDWLQEYVENVKADIREQLCLD